jgi:hypothetical protein
MWCWTVWMAMNRAIAKACRRNEYMAAQKTAQDVMDGEDSIIESMKRFANDAKCVEYLQGFKTETEAKMGSYKHAMVVQMKEELSERALKQLQAVSAFEANMGSAMQELVVREAASSFREQYPSNQGMKDKAFAAAVKSLGGTPLAAGDEPVATHFDAAFKSLQGVDLMTVKGNPTGTLPERVAYAQQAKEAEFQQSFMVTAEEAAEVKAIVSKAKAGDGFDFAKLPADSLARLNALYSSINTKVGFALPEVGTKPITATTDSAANAYVEAVNSQLSAAAAQLQSARLTAFAKSFA